MKICYFSSWVLLCLWKPVFTSVLKHGWAEMFCLVSTAQLMIGVTDRRVCIIRYLAVLHSCLVLLCSVKFLTWHHQKLLIVSCMILGATVEMVVVTFGCSRVFFIEIVAAYWKCSRMCDFLLSHCTVFLSCVSWVFIYNLHLSALVF